MVNVPFDKEQPQQEWLSDGVETLGECPVCGSKSRHQLYSGLTDRVFSCAPGRWDLYQCEGCRSAYLDPRPTPDTIHLAYQQYYTHQRPQRQATEELAAWRRFVRALANGYRNHRYRGQLEPQSSLGRWLIPIFPRRRESLDREMRYLPPLQLGGRLLDVGFGSGVFLGLAQRIGWQVYGADPDPVAVSNAQQAGLDVRQGGIEAFADMAGQFDVITLSHVIEHVHNPVDVVKKAYQLLKPGGSLYIATPNIDAYGHGKFKEHWRGLEIPRHLVIFNWESMESVLKQIGFKEIQKVISYSPYASLAGASRSIQRNIDPYAQPSIAPIDKFKELSFFWNPFASRNKTEFVTLNARKPNLR